MKRTVIKYRNIGKDRIEVVGIENAASKEEIRAEFGNNVADEYFKSFWVEYYYRERDGSVSIINSAKGVDGVGSFGLTAEETYDKQYLSNAIKYMRLAGERLGRIVKEERGRKKSKVKEIII